MNERLVETVARAMKEFASHPLYNLNSLDGVLVGSLGDAWPYLARAALSAIEAAGMAVVPREPTAEMLVSGGDDIAVAARDVADEYAIAIHVAFDVYKTMIAALAETASDV